MMQPQSTNVTKLVRTRIGGIKLPFHATLGCFMRCALRRIKKRYRTTALQDAGATQHGLLRSASVSPKKNGAAPASGNRTMQAKDQW